MDKQFADAPLTDKEEAVSTMHDALISFVKNIEASTPMTQNHYGAYMGLLGNESLDLKTKRGLARTLIKVGGNAQGVCDGFKAATGEEL